MSVVANVAINVDATKAVQQLKAVDAASKGIKGGRKERKEKGGRKEKASS